jgi:hypothetical protein
VPAVKRVRYCILKTLDGRYIVLPRDDAMAVLELAEDMDALVFWTTGRDDAHQPLLLPRRWGWLS